MLTVPGEVAHPLKLSLADLSELPRLTVSQRPRIGLQLLRSRPSRNLAPAGVELGEKLRGKSLALFVIRVANKLLDSLLQPRRAFRIPSQLNMNRRWTEWVERVNEQQRFLSDFL